MKITKRTRLCSVIKEAAKRAKGKRKLEDREGNRCLWGEVAHMCGVARGALQDHKDFGETLPGMLAWDRGEIGAAVELACRADEMRPTTKVGPTVGSFRKLLDLRLFPLVDIRS